MLPITALDPNLFFKSNPNAKQFKNKGFKHFEIFDLLMANMQAKGIHIHQRKNHAGSVASATSMPPPSMMPSTSTRPPAELHLYELSIATNEISGKCKASALGSDINLPSGKHSWPSSATAKAQQEGSTVIALIASLVEVISKHLVEPPPPPSLVTPDFALAIGIISDATYLTEDDKKIHPVFHASVLSSYSKTDVHDPNFLEPPPHIIKEEEYEIETITLHKRTGEQCCYLVTWKGCSSVDNELLPEENLQNST
ncbi:hypothetical protein BDR04DRAFT_1163429 [Suillus decipiens]|nr:hypothetical protein BDR04DRAFT_1163429 [Suillus decipiens]